MRKVMIVISLFVILWSGCTTKNPVPSNPDDYTISDNSISDAQYAVTGGVLVQ